MAKKAKRYVLVTTEFRGVFMGALESDDGTKVTLSEAQMCTYWTSDTHGVFGLASKGPVEGCRIGPPVERLTIRKVTAMADVSDEAVARWKEEPWS